MSYNFVMVIQQFFILLCGVMRNQLPQKIRMRPASRIAWTRGPTSSTTRSLNSSGRRPAKMTAAAAVGLVAALAAVVAAAALMTAARVWIPRARRCASFSSAASATIPPRMMSASTLSASAGWRTASS